MCLRPVTTVYGRQAVVVSIDPKRVWVSSPSDTTHRVVRKVKAAAGAGAPTGQGPNGEMYCWYQCTIKGGREARDLDAQQLAVAAEKMGTGELLVRNQCDVNALRLRRHNLCFRI